MRRPITLFFALLFSLAISSPLYAVEHAAHHKLDFRQASDAPYLMAFSVDPSPHFVIERADGTDSRVFAEGVMPASTSHVSGPGWSPAGKWFAWTTNGLYKFTNTGDTPYVMSADGQTRLTALDDMHRVDLAWSPMEDILLVAGLLNPPRIQVNPETRLFETVNEADTLTLRIGLLDPATDSFLQVQDMPAPFHRGDLIMVDFRIFWSADGTVGAIRPESGYFLNDAAAAIDFYTITRQGDFATHRIEIPMTDDDRLIYEFSPKGDIATFWLPDELRIQPLQGDILTVSLPPTTAIMEKWWSPDSDYLLMHTLLAPTTDEAVQGLWVWSRATNTLVELFNGIIAEGPYSESLISPSPDFSRVFYVITTPDGNIAQVSDLTGTQTLTFEDTPAPETLVIWNHTGQVAYRSADDPATPFVVYDVTGDAPLKLGSAEIAHNDYSTPSLSPYATTVAQIGQTLAFVNPASGEVLWLPADSRTYFTVPNGEVEWHPSLGWALRFDDALVAGGGYLRHTGVINEAGTVRRPIGYCESPTPICLDWLPAQVDPSTLAAGQDNLLPTPINSFETGYWMNEIIWSPDGTQLASTTEHRSWGEATRYDVWQLDTGEKIATFESVGWDQTIAWQAGQAQVVSRDSPILEDETRELAVSVDGKQTAWLVTEPDAEAALLELVDAEGNSLWTVPHSEFIWHDTASFSPDGRFIAAASGQTSVRILDTENGEVVGGLPFIHSAAVAFSPAGTQLAVAEGTFIQIYAVADLRRE